MSCKFSVGMCSLKESIICLIGRKKDKYCNIIGKVEMEKNNPPKKIDIDENILMIIFVLRKKKLVAPITALIEI